MTEATKGGAANGEQLTDALDATTRRLGLLVRHLEGMELDEEMSKRVRQARRQVILNREMLGIDPARPSNAS